MKQLITVGTDLIEVNRFEKFDRANRLAANTFTKRELIDSFERSNPAESLAARFAAKEAVVKCIGNVRYNKIEVKSDKNGKPEVEILDEKLSKMYNFSISLSHTKKIALAVCIACKIA